MTPTSLPPLDRLDVHRYFDPTIASQGKEYVRARLVGPVTWSPDERALRAVVQQQSAGPVDVLALMKVEEGRVYGFDFGHCSCRAEFDCKHVVAVLLQAKHDAATPALSDWSKTLAELAAPPARAALTVGRSAESPTLGLQLGLGSDRTNSVRLTAQPVRRSESGEWVADGISWDTLPRATDSSVTRQLEILRSIRALYSAFAVTRHPLIIDLAELQGRFVWDLLDEAAASGISIVRATDLEPLPQIGRAAFAVDILQWSSGELSLCGAIRIDGAAVHSDVVTFVGPSGYGLAYWDRDSDGQAFRLARFEAPVPTSVRSLTSQPVWVPLEDRRAFATSYLPNLERSVTVTSSDESYHDPVVTGPELVITVAHTGGHRIRVSGEWRYTIDDVELLLPADQPITSDGSRDTAHELMILDEVSRLVEVDRFRRAFPTYIVLGMEAAKFVLHAVPALHASDSVRVVIVGDPPDYADVSDDVTVSVSTRAVPGDNDWFDLGVDVLVDGVSVPLTKVIAGIARGEAHVLLDDGRYFDLRNPALITLRELIEEARSLQDAPEDPLRLTRFQVSLWNELAELGIVSQQAEAWKQQVSGLLELDSMPPAVAPPGLRADLRGYQLDGLRWLSFVYDHHLGGILADDMGLGKTVQALALVQRARNSGARPFLIVAPSSVVHNWVREATAFTPDLVVATATHTRTRRGHTIADLAEGADIVVTSYTVFRLGFDEFASVAWAGLILDEAQYVKNHHAKTYQCARKLDTPFKLAITGTPMENNLMELWALLSITSPGLFESPKKFTENYRRPIEVDGDKDVLAQLRRRVRPLMLRRTKHLVATELPPKQEQTIAVDLHPKHRRLYDTILTRERQKVLGLLGDFDRNRFMILRSLTLLRQLSLDPALIDDSHAVIPSAKTDELVQQLLEVARGGHRALVFSQFTRYLGRVRERLEGAGIGYEYLDGKTRDRGAVVERFRSGEAPVFLISLKAGGTGLTLTEADYCFVLDPWWNPATEAQAVDRAHRIGQSKTVFVNRYVARDTIEEKVMALKERKSQLFSGVLDEGGGFAGALTADDIRGLLQ